MQTVLGAGGPIADELVHELHRNHTTDIRLVGRKPSQVDDTDELVAADLTDAEATSRAVAGSRIAYLTVGLPLDSELWERQFPLIMRNVIDACAAHGTKLVFFDNTYMYPGTSAPQTESTPFAPGGRKGRVRGELATMLLEAVRAGRVQGLIGRAPEFYGPGSTKSYTNSLVFDRIRAGKRPFVPVNAHTKRSLIWTPDASRALALLGNTPDAYGQTWHLPIDPNRQSYAQLIEIAGEVTGRKIGYTVLPMPAFRLGRRFVEPLEEMYELIGRYRYDNIFDSSKFAARFPDFQITTYREGVERILADRPPDQPSR
ncbi:NAD-dependent epimerase/dehydratase family protein [Nocardia testacea]|uniref:NAD-dependent epimerase/dehydratase family protein n=1 Tax=Nocardia testacea TaxID=248551 RepID=A0ABW7VVI4_9NOCA